VADNQPSVTSQARATLEQAPGLSAMLPNIAFIKTASRLAAFNGERTMSH